MILTCLTSSPLRNRIAHVPLTLVRHKSLRASIERGAAYVEPQKGNRNTYRERPATDSGQNPSDPYSLPYTTAASEFLYGYSTVLAALKAKRRLLYKLYVHPRGSNNENITAVLGRAQQAKLNVIKVGDKYLRSFDRASSGRPHNGFILEASPLPRPPILELDPPSKAASNFSVVLDRQSKEDAVVNGKQTTYTYKSAGWRYPMVLYADGVLDEGNLGSMTRSAYYFGVDAIITPTRQCAPWSQITLKASSGAAEAIPIFSVNNPADFLMKCARNGWRLYASDAIPPEQQRPILDSSPRKAEKEDLSSRIIYSYARSPRRLPADYSPVANNPTMLMMGAESTGLTPTCLNHAHFKVGLRGGRDVDEVGVDSLNVSVASGLLCYEMLQKPSTQRRPGDLLF